MNRNRCSSARPPEGTALPASPIRRICYASALAVAGLLLWTLHAAPLAAQGAPAKDADEPACPAERELCVQAERSGAVDLRTGIAHLEGNVRGVVRSRALSFRSNSLKAFRNGGQEWVRLVLEEDVRMRQADRRTNSDHGVLEREEIRLTGNVHIAQEGLSIEGHEALIRADLNRTVVHGLPEAPLRMQLDRALVAEPEDEAAERPASPQGSDTPAPAEPLVTHLSALKAVLEDQPRRVTLTGDVRVEQSDRRLHIEAQQVQLFFTPESSLAAFQAEGNVVIVQPERRISADFAQSRNELKTVLLVGHATLQQTGQFDLKSDRMEVYMDSREGIMQSQDRQKPITLSLDMAGPRTIGLTHEHLLSLSDQAVPASVLDKLGPLVGTTYPTRAAFREAVQGRLTRRESQRFLDAILAVVP